MRLLKPALLAFPLQSFLAEPFPNGAGRQFNARPLMDGTLKASQCPQFKRITHTAGFLQSQINELTSVHTRMAGRMP